ncbi:hypothetical protein [Flavobacterium sp. ABG]|uniref:hypothetical protein n=1 Tax=Flavobacterium sp. ABG TaxID=1423322 RepID=UPI00064AD3D5|nr:hypothetical protein [Flavobacterium sp. ABG]KLT69476.1 hypothetical protein AB674_12550 [Flavobacterium sp. ABG]
MSKDSYINAKNAISKVIDIAIYCFRNYTPNEWDTKTSDVFVEAYLECRERALNPEPRYETLKSLKYVINDVFIYFQEGGGNCVEEFWKEIKKQNLPYKRENKMLKILKRKKINNIREYDFVIDVIVPYQQEGLINSEEVVLLNELIGKFERLGKK